MKLRLRVIRRAVRAVLAVVCGAYLPSVGRAQAPAVPAAPAEDAAIESIEAAAKRDRELALRRTIARYADELAALEAALRAKGDNNGAAQAAAELAKVKAALADVTPDAARKIEQIAASLNPPDTTAATPAPAPPKEGEKEIKFLYTEGIKPADAVSPFWSVEKAQITWPLKAVPPGVYSAEIRYEAQPQGGGKFSIFSPPAPQTKVPGFSVTAGEGAQKAQATGIRITESSKDLALLLNKMDNPKSATRAMLLTEIVLRKTGELPKAP